ncbi:MAG: hypothetical protein M3177_03490 [Pseudomonadota bacterium]|nr:hypothetical protein [Pseudomonadota bacterium]
MNGEEGLDLTGQWSGFYNYPVPAPAVNFEAVLRDAGGRLTGTIVEPDDLRGGTLSAVIDGYRQGAAVSFLKMYDQADEYYDTVQYSGTVASGGDEIEGRWQVQGGWSGTFLMVRTRGGADEAERKAAEVIGREI